MSGMRSSTACTSSRANEPRKTQVEQRLRHAFAIDCYENGIITKKDTGGIELTWGNHKAIVAMTEKLAKREGFGDIIADGVKIAAKKIGKGAEKYAMHAGGEEIAAHDSRGGPGFAIGYGAEPTPGRHTQGGEGLR